MHRIEQISAWQWASGNLTGDGPAERVAMGRGTSSLFSLLGTRPLIGRLFAPEEDQHGHDQVAVLTDGFWQRRFAGDSRVLGRTVRIDGTPFVIVGVLPRAFTLGRDVDLWIPLSFDPIALTEDRRGSHFLKVLGRLAPGVTLEQAKAELDLVGARLRSEHAHNYPSDAGWNPIAVPMLQNMVETVQPSLWMLMGAVGFVLLIGCANVANLLLARGSTRHRELSVRAALGAGRSRLMRQLLTEGLILAILGGGIGLLLSLWCVDLLVAMGPADLPRSSEIGMDGGVLAFSLAVTLGTGVLFGLLPALMTSRVDLHDALRAGARASAGRRPRQLRRALVVAEIALALVLLASAGLLVRSFARVLHTDPGYDPEHALALHIALPGPMGEDAEADRARYGRFFAEATERLRRLQGVDATGAANILPMSGDDSDNTFQVADHPRPEGVAPPDEQIRFITPGFFESMKIPLLRGRAITKDDGPERPYAVVVSESFARRYWPGEDALGRHIVLDWEKPRDATVVGIVGDVHVFGLDAPIKPVMYWAHAQMPYYARMAIVLRSSMPPAALEAAARAELAGMDPDQPIYDVQPLTQLVGRSLAARRFALVLLETLAALALGLAALGLYSVMAHSVEQRTHEIGVRMALGAQRANVLGMVARESAGMVAVGIGLGIIGALMATRWLSGLLYQVSPSDPLVLALGVAILCASSAVASVLPARRASRVDPMVALREE
jgi:predicted permease